MEMIIRTIVVVGMFAVVINFIHAGINLERRRFTVATASICVGANLFFAIIRLLTNNTFFLYAQLLFSLAVVICLFVVVVKGPKKEGEI